MSHSQMDVQVLTCFLWLVNKGTVGSAQQPGEIQVYLLP